MMTCSCDEKTGELCGHHAQIVRNEIAFALKIEREERATDPTKVRVLCVMHERGCHGRKRHNRTCACWREAFKMLAADPDLILSDGTRGGIK